MQTCSNCGASVREGARFCTACGTQLNEASSGSSPFSWGAAIEQTAAPEGGWPTAATEAALGNAEETDTINETSPTTTTWNWGESSNSLPTEAVDEETGIVLDDPDREPDTGLVDPTEIDDLVAPASSDEPTITEDVEPDLAIVEDEAVVSIDDETAGSDEDQETLAVWAQSWAVEPESTDSEPVATAADDEEILEVLETVDIQESTAIDVDEEDEEATLAKAERLIAELQSLVPRLARPKPVNPNQKLTPQLLAEELEDRTDGSQWADLREVLEKARDNPNDITHLMSVSGNASRLLDLLDDRDKLANRASSVAQRLRNPDASNDD